MTETLQVSSSVVSRVRGDMSVISACRSELAPGGVPTMVVNDAAYLLGKRGVLKLIASKLAPTGV
jgi:hypothetical protein